MCSRSLRVCCWPPQLGDHTPTHVIMHSYGVFQEWYLSHPPFENASEASVNAIGTVTLAIQYSEGLLLQFVAQRRPQWLRPIMLGALVTCIASLFLSSFATKVRRSAASMSRELKVYFLGMAPHLASRSYLWNRRRMFVHADHNLGACPSATTMNPVSLTHLSALRLVCHCKPLTLLSRVASF